MNLVVIVLAAGQGKRMVSTRPKVLHTLCGRPMIDYVIDAAHELGARQIIGVVENDGLVAQHLRSRSVDLAFQPVRQGTGDAARIGLQAAHAEATHVLVLNGDVPLLQGKTLKAVCHAEDPAQLHLLVTEMANPTGYGRVFEENGQVRIIEQADATDLQRQHRIANVGVYFGPAAFFREQLPLLKNDNRQGEYYLTDLAHQAARCRTVLAESEQETLGVNTREQLADVEAVLRARKNRDLMLAGVTLRDPQRTYLDWDVTVGPETEIYAGVTLQGKTEIGAGCTLYPNVRIAGSRVEDGAVILDGSVIEGSVVGAGSQVGPMAHLRTGTVLGQQCRIGNFVETKKARFGDHSKASHLSYLGDAEIGQDVNIGCGTITCNYDGVHKYKTVIEDGVFVGSDTQLVAPVRVGRGAVLASGSTVTSDVPAEALFLSRAPGVVKPGYAVKYWARRREQDPGSSR